MINNTKYRLVRRLVGKLSSSKADETIFIIFSDKNSSNECKCLTSLGASIIVKVEDTSEKLFGFWERVYNEEKDFKLPIIIQLFPNNNKEKYEYGLVDNNAMDKTPKHIPLGPPIDEFITEIYNYFSYVE